MKWEIRKYMISPLTLHNLKRLPLNFTGSNDFIDIIVILFIIIYCMEFLFQGEDNNKENSENSGSLIKQRVSQQERMPLG
jgi:hypothetical protein